MQKSCKKILFIFLLGLNSLFVKAQWVTIPDSNFVNFLNTYGYASCMNGNLMDTTCAAVVNEDNIYCNNSNIADLTGIQYFDNLITLNCSGNNLTSIPPLPGSLFQLICGYNQLTTLPDIPNSLEGLYCFNNQFTALPVLPNTLRYLDCSQNNLLSLPDMPDSLLILYCLINPLTSLPNLPPVLQELYCDQNQLTSLPNLPSSLTHLECTNNYLTSLPALPSSLLSLDCGSNLITSLPSLPNSLTSLECPYNQLTSLPLLPNNLMSLICSSNQIINLPQLPNTLFDLECEYNIITSLPSLPNTVWMLACGHNQLTSLPPIYNTQYIYCSDNLLTSLPNLPDTVTDLHIESNPNLTCLPEFKVINSLHWANTGITCLPNAGTVGTAVPPINNLPLCLSNSGCDFHWNIFGRIYSDANANCLRDTTELLFKNIPVQLDSGGSTLQTFIGNTNGFYSFQTGLGNYQIKIDTTGLPFDVVCPASGNYLSSLTAVDSLDADLDFGLQCKPGYLDLIAKSISVSAILRPGAHRTLYLDAGDAVLFYGVTCATGVSGSVQAILNGPVSYFSPGTGALTPTAASGDTVTWNVNDFSLINPSVDFNIIIQVDSTATINDTVCAQLDIFPVAGDNIPSNNSVSNCFSIANSADPNLKQIYPGGFIDTTNHEFTFTVYFQNTGNAVAENIYILDTLDDDLDVNTFQFLSSSHDAVTQLLPGNILRFSFPNINLADSVSDEPASHGYVQFKMRRKNILYPDMIIVNRAQIFFDLNPPVTTNDAYAVLTFDCNDLLTFSIADTALCENEMLIASNNVNFPFPVNYEWLIDSVSVSASSSISVSGLSPGVHQLTLNAAAGYCTVSQTQQIIVYPLPAQPVINISGDTLSAGNGFFYQWFLNNDSIIGAVQNNYLVSQSGWYSVMVSDSNGCSALSDSVYVSPVGMEEIRGLRFNVYPNPVNDMLYIQTISEPGEILNIELLDMTGRKLQTIFNGKLNCQLSKFSLVMKPFSKGVFVLRVNNVVRKVVVE